MYKSIDDFKIFDELSSFVYVTSTKTHSLFYVNKALKHALNLDDNYQNLKCYQIMEGLNSPCSFCKSIEGNKKNILTGRFVSQLYDEYQISKQKITINNEEHLLVMMNLPSETKMADEIIKDKRYISQIIENLIEGLTTKKTLHRPIDEALVLVMNYYGASRVYVYEYDYIQGEARIIYEHYKNEKKSLSLPLTRFSIDKMTNWNHILETEHYIKINNIQDSFLTNTEQYPMLQDEQLKNIWVYPFFENGKVIGFIGINNATKNIEREYLLKALSFFMFYDISKRITIRRLELLSKYDSLTLLMNRNSYNEKLMKFSKTYLDSIGIIFIDMNGLKETNDALGHKEGDKLLKQLGSSLRKYFKKYAYRIGGDEFILLFDNISKEEFDIKVELVKRIEENNKNISFAHGEVFEEKPNDIQGLIIKADKIMYENKHHKKESS